MPANVGWTPVKCFASPWQKINLTGPCAKDSCWSKASCEWPKLYAGRAKQAGVNKKEVQLCKTATLLSLAYKGHFTSYFPWWFGSCRSTGWPSGRWRAESNNSSMAERHKKDNGGASGNHLHRNHCLTETTKTNDWRLKWNLNHLKQTKGRGGKPNTETKPQTWRTLPDVWCHVSASVCVCVCLKDGMLSWRQQDPQWSVLRPAQSTLIISCRVYHDSTLISSGASQAS